MPNSSKQYPFDNSSSSLSPTTLSPSNKIPVTSTPIKPNSLNVKISMIQQQQQNTNKESSTEPISGDLSERGRERKKTTIFGTIRKRLSRSKTRNEENNGISTATNGYGESHLGEYSSNVYSNSLDSRQKDNFQLKTNNTLKSPSGTLNKMGISGSSRRSSISEMSGLSRLSSISNKTFIHEASSLVLEVVENGVKR